MKKKPVSKKQRNDIKRALDSLPSLLVEHVAFSDDEDMSHEERQKESARKKYIPSENSRKAHQKKQQTVGLGVGLIIISLLGLWFLNAKSFFFDAKHTTSSEEVLIHNVKRDFDNTIGVLSERQKAAESAALLAATSSTTSTTETTTTTATSTETSNEEMEYLKAALSSLLSSSTASSSADSSSTTTTSTTTSTESTETEVPTTSNRTR